MLRDLRVAVSNASHSLHHSGLMRPLHSAALGAAINGFDIEAPARTGPCFKTPDARGHFW